MNVSEEWFHLVFQGMCGRITGHFASQDEASCRPRWSEINYKVASLPVDCLNCLI